MAKADRPAVLVTREAFVCELDGQQYDLKGGDLIEADHPLVKKYPDHFADPVFRFPAPGRVEQATAAPGEKRGR
jgi:hypothetical protein